MSAALNQLSTIAQQAASIQVSGKLVAKQEQLVSLELSIKSYGTQFFIESKRAQRQGGFYREPLKDALPKVAKTVGEIVDIDQESIAVKSSKSPLKGKALKELCIDALYETFNLEPPSAEALQEAQKAKQKAANAKRQRREEFIAMLTTGRIKEWNRMGQETKDLAPFQNVKLSGLNLAKMNFVDIPGGDFANSDLGHARAQQCKLAKSNFKQANLTAACFHDSNLKQVDFTQASLDKAVFKGCDLQGANFTGTNLQTTRFENCYHDETTIWDAANMPKKGLRWLGQGVDPVALAAVEARKKTEGPVDIAQFMKRLEKNIDKARVDKALKMLKKDSFQLFIDVNDEALTGVVKSQNDPDLVYSCQLTASGDFGCCTQNLNPCGGLRGALCKHIMVLIIGLANSGEMDADTLDDWVQRSLLQSPKLDKDAMSAILLKYKGADAGEIDWRPTETVPEDFYVF